MIKRIELKKYGTGRYTDSAPFNITDDLTVEFMNMTEIGEYTAVCGIGGKRQKLRITDGKITLSKEWLTPGLLFIKVLLSHNEVVAATWQAENLLLTATAHGFQADPDIVRLHREIADLKELLNRNSEEAAEKIQAAKLFVNQALLNFKEDIEEKLESLQESEHRNRIGYLKYIYRDYKHSLSYSSEYTFTDFAEKFSIRYDDLLPSEISEIEEISEDNSL